MTWFLSILVLVILVLFMLTWFNISQRADVDQHRDLKRRFDTLSESHDALLKLRPPNPLDKLITLDLYPAAPGGEGDGYFNIRPEDIYGKCYSSMAGCEDGSKRQPTSREITLRELLNRVLKDIPVELVHEVKPDWSFTDAPMVPTVNLHMIQPPYVVDNRKSPLDPYPPVHNTGPADLFKALGLVPKPIVFSPHSCGLDGIRFNDHN